MSARRYATGTQVPVEKSRLELERLLHTHGAESVAVYKDASRSAVVFRMAGFFVRHEVRVPDDLPPNKVEAEYRRRWRALILLVKAKLEAIAAGDSTVDREFLSDILVADGRTVYSVASEQLADSYASGEMPRFMLGPGG